MLRCRTWLMVCFVIASCAREPQLPTPATDLATATKPVTPLPDAASAESSLSIKRGVITRLDGRTTYRPCDENVQLGLLDRTDGGLHKVFSEGRDVGSAELVTEGNGLPIGNNDRPTYRDVGSAELVGNMARPIYVEVYAERTEVPQGVASARGYSGALLLEEILYAAELHPGSGCPQQAPAYIVLAQGSEPLWSAEIRDQEIWWRHADVPNGIAMQIPATTDAEGSVGYRGVATGYELEIQIEGQPCRNALSGEYFAYSAKATMNGKQFNGCARLGR